MMVNCFVVLEIGKHDLGLFSYEFILEPCKNRGENLSLRETRCERPCLSRDFRVSFRKEQSLPLLDSKVVTLA